MSLTANLLETSGIPTVIVGSAIDIVEHVGAARFLYTDFPLGNPMGPPYDAAAQAIILEEALHLLETAETPGTIRHSLVPWPGEQAWRWGYNYVGPENREELAAIGEERRRYRDGLKK